MVVLFYFVISDPNFHLKQALFYLLIYLQLTMINYARCLS